MMTKNEIRDICAYYGAPCMVQYEAKTAQEWGVFGLRQVDAQIIGLLANDQVTRLQLHLRPITSLTDDEVRHCARLFGASFVTSEHLVKRTVGHKCKSGYVEITEACFALFEDGDIDNAERSTIEIESVSKIISHLQSLGVYVPGTIDKKYVHLISINPASRNAFS